MNGVGLITVGRLLGYRKRRTTAIYAHLDDAVWQDATAQAAAVIAGAMGYRTAPPPLPDEADGDGDGATPDTAPAGAAQPPPPGSAERPINSLRIVRIQDLALRAFRQSRGDIRQAGHPQCSRIFALRTGAANPLPDARSALSSRPACVRAGVIRRRTLARRTLEMQNVSARSVSNNKQLLSLPRWLRIGSCSMRFDETAVDLARSEAVTCLCFVPWTFCGSGFPVPRAFRGFSPRALHTRPTPCSPPWPLLRIARHRWRTAAE